MKDLSRFYRGKKTTFKMQVANKQDTLTIDCLKAGVLNLVAQPAKRDGLKKAQKKSSKNLLTLKT